MIPEKGLINTGWISKKENEKGKSAAFIVLTINLTTQAK